MEFMDASYAVEAFFMLSGFYMALILDRTYQGWHAYRIFIENRLLRIFPVYWVTLALTIPLVWYGSVASNMAASGAGLTNLLFTSTFSTVLEFPSIVLLAVSHLFIVGTEFVYFLIGSPSGTYGIVEFNAAPRPESVPLGLFLFVPQAWSLSLEMMFYLAAPFLVRWRTRNIVGLLLLSLALCAVMALTTNLMERPLQFRFKSLPNEFWTFAAGILMYRAYGALQPRLNQRRVAVAAVVLLIAASILYRYIPGMQSWVYLALVFVFVPLAFPLYERDQVHSAMVEKLLAVDRFAGDLSYPLYISHALALWSIYAFWPGGSARLGVHFALFAAAWSVVVATLMLKLVSEPVDRARARNRARLEAGPDRATLRREARTERRRSSRSG